MPAARDRYDPSDPLKGATECPHCGSHAVTLRHDEHRYVCGVCGGPRVRIDTQGVELSGGEAAPLELAQAGRKSRFWWRLWGVFGGLVGAFGLLATTLMVLLFEPGLIGAGLGLAAALPFLLLAFTALGKSKARTEDIQRAIDGAWTSAARDIVLASPDGLTARQLSKQLPVSEQAAETILAELSVDDMLQSRVTDDGKLQFSATAAARIEIDAQAAEGGAPLSAAERQTLGTANTVLDAREVALKARFEALEEAVAEEEQAAAEAAAEATAAQKQKASK
ncbi:MAG: zinc ribbon domain-containing protein [Deltaproteobacteria bacterium]|nr:zinc ribbon domain-containing protein [Deltaproteobacteria bacterium]